MQAITHLAPEWRDWIRENLARGCALQSLVDDMVRQHFDAGFAQTSVQRLAAGDAEAVRTECEAFVRCLSSDAGIVWRNDGISPVDRTRVLSLAIDPQNERVLEVVASDTDLATWSDMLGWLGRLASARLRQLAETANLYEAISRLALAERLQRALYAIAEQAGAEHNMKDMMSALHAIEPREKVMRVPRHAPPSHGGYPSRAALARERSAPRPRVGP